MYNDYEIVEGVLTQEPNLFYTKTGKAICKNKLTTEDEVLSLIAWEANAEALNNLPRSSSVKLEGYRKYNDFENAEQFVITEFKNYNKG